MYFLTYKKNFHQKFFSLLISLIPLSFIAGNLVINLNISLIIVFSLIFFWKDVFKIEYFFLDKLIFSYFILILITGIYNDYNLFINFNEFSSFRGSYATTLKSFLFLRYFLLYIILRYLIEKNLVNFKIFFIVCAFTSIFVSLDIFYQLLSGKDIFGYKLNPNFRKLGGPFGDEYIAGGFIQRFSLFAFFIYPIFYKKFKKMNFYIIPIFMTIFLVGIILSGNRMPLILFILTLSLVFIFEIKEKKKFFPLILLGLFTFLIIFNFNTKVKTNFKEFYITLSRIVAVPIENNNNEHSVLIPTGVPYLYEFISFYDTWLQNKTIGGGIKNFNFYCHDGPKKKIDIECNLHPHNYYLEILTETGLIGFFIVLIIFIKSLHQSFYKKYFLAPSHNNKIIIPFIFLFFVEIFPIKSTGSFFTTGNASYIFLILAILIGLSKKHYYIENKY
jgi:O-antigen ligase